MNKTMRCVTLGLLVLTLIAGGAFFLKWTDFPHERPVIIASEPSTSSVSDADADEQPEPVRETTEEAHKTPTEKLWLLDWENVSPDELAELIKSGADVNAKNKYGETPLMRAARDNANAEVIAALVSAGADVNAKNKYGKTPLMWVAINNANAEVITAFIKAGADVNAKDKNGLTVLKFAEDNKSENKSEIMALLWKAISGDIETVPQRRDENEE